jgi:hypothetical protein
MGTLNEFTIAYDEGKVVGVLEGTGGVADRILQIAALSSKLSSEIVSRSTPEDLIDACLEALNGRN